MGHLVRDGASTAPKLSGGEGNLSAALADCWERGDRPEAAAWRGGRWGTSGGGAEQGLRNVVLGERQPMG